MYPAGRSLKPAWSPKRIKRIKECISCNVYKGLSAKLELIKRLKQELLDDGGNFLISMFAGYQPVPAKPVHKIEEFRQILTAIPDSSLFILCSMTIKNLYQPVKKSE